MGRGNTENCEAAWDAATRRTARQHGTRQQVELRRNMGRGNTENCAAAWDAATRRTARHHGTRQHIELRGSIGRRNTENCAAPWDATTQMRGGNIRVRGTTGNVETIWPRARHQTPRKPAKTRVRGSIVLYCIVFKYLYSAPQQP